MIVKPHISKARTSWDGNAGWYVTGADYCWGPATFRVACEFARRESAA